MNRATKENIEAADALGWNNIGPCVFNKANTVQGMFEEWENVRKKYPHSYICINGVMLCSDIDVDVTYDDYCMMVFGKPSETQKREWRQELKKECERIERDQRAFRRKIPKLYFRYAHDERSTALIPPDKLNEWSEAVRYCLEGMYGDLCIRCCLEIIECLQDGDAFDEVIKKIEDYGHSGYSWSQTRRLVELFGGVRGKSFAEWEREKRK